MADSSSGSQGKTARTTPRPLDCSRHEAPTTTGTRTPISSSITSAMPSTPRANRTPKSGIHATDVRSWNRGPEVSKATVASTASNRTTRLTPRASWRARASRPRGSEAVTAAPTAGSTIITSRNGNELTVGELLARRIASSSRRHREKCTGHQHRAAEHPEGAAADESGLEPPETGRRATQRGGNAVDRAVHAAVVDEHQ